MHLLVLFISNLRDARSYNPKVLQWSEWWHSEQRISVRLLVFKVNISVNILYNLPLGIAHLFLPLHLQTQRNRPWDPYSCLHNACRCFLPWLNRPRRSFVDPLPYSAKVMNEKGYTSTPPFEYMPDYGMTSAFTSPSCWTILAEKLIQCLLVYDNVYLGG